MLSYYVTISNHFYKYFSEIGNSYASRILTSNKPFSHYLKSKYFNKSFFMEPTDPIEISRIITSLGKPTYKKKSYLQKEISENNYIHINKSNMTNYLDNFDLNTLNTMNINEATELILKTIQYSLDKFAPEKTIHIPYKNITKQPWMTPALLKSAKNRDILFRKSIGKSNTSKQHTYFIKYRNIYNKLKNISKQTYYNTELNKYKKDVRKTWNIRNTLIGRQHNKSGISEMFKIDNKSGISEMFKIDNKSITDPNTISNHFYKYFSEIGNSYASRILTSNKPFSHYLKSKYFNKSFFMEPTDPIEISRIITSLKPKNSSGHDGISSKLLKCLNPSISN